MNEKKYEEKNAHAKDRTQTSSGITAKLKFPGHLQKLVQNNNWCVMVQYQRMYVSHF
jgi:hypothetical protein